MQFDFGKNWDDFSKNALTADSISQAKEHFDKLFSGIDIIGKSFVDIGFGQGLSLLIASEKGAKTVGCDINPKCKNVLEKNLVFFRDTKIDAVQTIIGSILKSEIVDVIKNCSPDRETSQYDIVHSWGVLHHTGKMWKAIDNSMQLVEKDGWYIIAIYNKHWSSGLWNAIKWFYNISPGFLKWFMIKIFYVIISIAKFIVTGKNPFTQVRGMSFYYDIIDWLGGYPYEYASVDEIKNYIEKQGFRLIRFNMPATPTGCNEFVFQKKGDQ
ncbi:MAG: methyltransferase domain-containing protein [Bacteroidetes bacterium]|nr:methyltransferase domain-containing protein [Bacteroidota bacterium]